jgi:hypothetical protein
VVDGGLDIQIGGWVVVGICWKCRMKEVSCGVKCKRTSVNFTHPQVLDDVALVEKIVLASYAKVYGFFCVRFL